MKRKKSELSPLLKALRTGAIIFGLFVLYAYATQATEVNLEAPLAERRQQAVMRALRGLARPDVFDFNEETRSIDVSIRMPCPEEVRGSRVTLGERLVEVTPNCATTTQDSVTVRGSGFRPFTGGLLRWYPPSTVEGSTRALTRFRTDATGNFEVTFTMPDIRPSDEPQRIEVEEKWTTGIAGLSNATRTTLEKITETVLLALIATTFGTLLSIPISFLAARNLMENIGSPLAAIMAGVVALPVGYVATNQVVRFIFEWTDRMGVQLATVPSGGEIAMSVGLSAVAILAMIGVLRVTGGLVREENADTASNWRDTARLLLLLVLGLFVLGHVADVGSVFGRWLEGQLGSFGFIGGFIAIVFEFIDLTAPALFGLVGGLIAMSLGSRTGQEAILRLDTRTARLITIVLGALGSAILVYGIASGLNWLYVFDQPTLWTVYPAIGAAILGAIGGALMAPKRPMPVGFIIYTAIRSILNIIRSIEPLVYVIIFAVWVGIGPFAGILALMLHTVAALGKLFSEQVENISEGPIEAITATGANRIQTVMYAVVPQIVPPYIAFTLYRWDINVRMSTIIGFGGGGGIGFVLAQAINLLQYRQASVMMISIALVVMTLDYVSSKVRQRIL
jgi:phosphonate ABC transporter permease subunit PhnE